MYYDGYYGKWKIEKQDVVEVVFVSKLAQYHELHDAHFLVPFYLCTGMGV